MFKKCTIFIVLIIEWAIASWLAAQMYYGKKNENINITSATAKTVLIIKFLRHISTISYYFRLPNKLAYFHTKHLSAIGTVL